MMSIFIATVQLLCEREILDSNYRCRHLIASGYDNSARLCSLWWAIDFLSDLGWLIYAWSHKLTKHVSLLSSTKTLKFKHNRGNEQIIHYQSHSTLSQNKPADRQRNDDSESLRWPPANCIFISSSHCILYYHFCRTTTTRLTVSLFYHHKCTARLFHFRSWWLWSLI